MNRHVLVYRSIVLRSADWASPVRASASSKKMILNSASPTGDVRAKFLILWRTTSMPRSSLAFNSVKLECHVSPKSSLAMDTADAVLPTPGGPVNIRCGRFLVCTYEINRPIALSCPTTSASLFGRYFSIHISCLIENPPHREYVNILSVIFLRVRLPVAVKSLGAGRKHWQIFNTP